LLKNKRIPAGTLLVEAFYQIHCPAPQYLQVERFLPSTVLRCLLNANGQDMSAAVNHEQLSAQCFKADRGLARRIVESQQDVLANVLEKNQAVVLPQAEALKEKALAAMQAHQQEEIQRLAALQEINPAVRPEEVEFLRQQTRALTEHLEKTTCELAAIRVIVATEKIG